MRDCDDCRKQKSVVTRGYFEALNGKRIAVVINKLRTFPSVEGYALSHLNALEEKLYAKAELVHSWIVMFSLKSNALQTASTAMFYDYVFVSFGMTREKLMSIMSIGNVQAEKSTWC